MRAVAARALVAYAYIGTCVTHAVKAIWSWQLTGQLLSMSWSPNCDAQRRPLCRATACALGGAARLPKSCDVPGGQAGLWCCLRMPRQLCQPPNLDGGAQRRPICRATACASGGAARLPKSLDVPGAQVVPQPRSQQWLPYRSVNRRPVAIGDFYRKCLDSAGRVSPVSSFVNITHELPGER